MTIYHDVGGKPTQTPVPLITYDKPRYEYIWDGKIRSFLDAIKNGGSAPVPSSEILYNQAIIDSICKSAELGMEVEVEIPEI